MLTQFSRTELLLGKEAMDKLKNSRVAVFGIGGVGGYVCEALVRSGIGAFDLIDDDKVCLTNLNRQIIATRKTVGKYKVDVMKERMLEINPDVNVRIHKCFFLPENADEFPFDEYDYVVDAVDTVTAKIELVMKSQAMNVPIISSMGAGNKLDASAFKVDDIYKTQMCPLAKVMRRELKKRHVKKLKVVYSEEKPTRPIEDMAISCRNHCICPPGAEHKCTERRDIPGSVAFVPSVAGNKNKIAGAPAGRISKPGICCQNLQQMPGFFVSFFFTDFPENRLFYKVLPSGSKSLSVRVWIHR